MSKQFDVIVVGGGHAGCEAALAAARRGCSTLLLTINLDTIALMPCNPAIGGLAKGHLVREIDALGGEMARCIDKTGIQFRMLNTRKGPAVQALRAQADKQSYRLEMKSVLEKQEGLCIKQGLVIEILVENKTAIGVKTETGFIYMGKTVILTTGTFLNGYIHIGLESKAAGRAGEFPSRTLSHNLEKLGFEIGRLKTGTCPRLDAKTIDFLRLQEQKGDDSPVPFSHSTESISQPQVSCYITYTTPETHEIIKNNLDRSPLFSGRITGVGPRYCPSIEDKVIRFPEKSRHQIFLEPEGRQTQEIYANGVSTSLPLDIQVAFIRTIPGLEDVEIMRPGYAVEYDFVLPTQLFPSMETKRIKNLFHAGQINGTSGYEEAAAQGLIAGINAVQSVFGKEALILQRSEAYIGVLLDDLVTKGTQEPYRMFTSRAEYRLLLRHDNADLRLIEKAYTIGLVSNETYKRVSGKKVKIKKHLKQLKNTIITPNNKTSKVLEESGVGKIHSATSIANLLRRPGVKYDSIRCFLDKSSIIDRGIIEQIEIQIKYEGYITRQQIQVEKFKRLEKKRLPEDLDYNKIFGLSTEVREKLFSIKPVSIGQASRISGVTPSAISIMMIFLEKNDYRVCKTTSRKIKNKDKSVIL